MTDVSHKLGISNFLLVKPPEGAKLAVTVHEFMLAGATGEGNQPGQLEDSS